MTERTHDLPLLALPSAVVLPGTVVTAEVTHPRNLRALERAPAAGHRAERCVVAPLADPDAEITPAGLLGVGVLARVVGRIQLPGGALRLVLHGLRRVALGPVTEEDGLLRARSAELREPPAPIELPGTDAAGGTDAADELARVVELLGRLGRVDPRYPEDLAGLVELNDAELGSLTDLLAGQLPLAYDEQARLLAECSPEARLRFLRRHLASALERARVGRTVEGKVKERIRRSFLREQLEVLRDELGEPDARSVAADRLTERVGDHPLPESAHQHALHVVESLRRASPTSPEAARLRAHLEWLLGLPWSNAGQAAVDSEDRFLEVARALNRSHCGLKDVKQRVLEFLAVHRLGGGARGTVLCFYGPPGTGKSSMGRAVARALGRPFAAIPVGGMTHESELVGASHLQEGGFPGALLQEIHRLGRNDPVILLDEIDKLSLGNEGDAGGALLQLLDPDQNSEFLDHFLGVPFDLSSCLFLVTANDMDAMPDALIDRLEVIEFAGYTESEKAAIARKHLLPRAREAAGLESWQFQLTPATLRTIIRTYTEEAGVRHLQRRLNALARKAAVEVVNGGKGLWLRKADLARLLGPPLVDDDLRFLKPAVGVATGLAWTSHGGALLPIEALAMPGNGSLTLTGSVGEVMRESVQTALSWARTRLKALGVPPTFPEEVDLHLHFPAGGTPKDGPSAGIAIATVLVSLLTQTPSRHDVAMTGEMSLLGHVLPVGGLREKLLASIRSGIPEVIVPQRNAEEILRLPPEIRSQLTIHLVNDVDEVLAIALLPREAGGKAPAAPKRRSTRRAEGRRRKKRRPAS
ncbi:MAG: endopeptidase La [Planctomycetota bacterium]